MKIIIASQNPNKVKEISDYFKDSFDTISLRDMGITADASETHDSFIGNAIEKATFYSKLTGLPCISEDSGLEVELLNNRPGVLSARWTGSHADDKTNNEKLVCEMHKNNITSSPARYVTAVAYVDVAKNEKKTATGILCGVVKDTPSGSNGFSYDPYFYINGRSLGDYSLEEKNKISHRTQAINNLLKKMSLT